MLLCIDKKQMIENIVHEFVSFCRTITFKNLPLYKGQVCLK